MTNELKVLSEIRAHIGLSVAEQVSDFTDLPEIVGRMTNMLYPHAKDTIETLCLAYQTPEMAAAKLLDPDQNWYVLSDIQEHIVDEVRDAYWFLNLLDKIENHPDQEQYSNFVRIRDL